MGTSSYRWIFALLSFSAITIILLQAFWISNFYLEKKEQFRSDVHHAMDQIIRKLHDREQLQVVKSRGDSLIALRLKKKQRKTEESNEKKTGSRERSIVFSDTRALIVQPSDSVLASLADLNAPIDSQVSQVQRRLKALNRQMLANPKSISVVNHSHNVNLSIITSGTNILSTGTSGEENPSARLREAEMDRFMERIITEVRIEDSGEKDQDTLNMLIAEVLAARGIESPFEFSLRHMKAGKDSVLSQSNNFDPEGFSYRGDLSQHRILSTGNYLYLQFPKQDSIVLANMKNSLALSLLFMAVILFVFYHTLRLILRQKKLSDIRNDFVNNMTHELKTPIATIGLAIDAMNHPQARDDKEKLRKYGGILKEENDKLNRHVERVLQLSLLEKGEVRLKRAPIGLKALGEEVAAGFMLQAAAQRATINVSMPEDDIMIEGERDHILAVISNLVDNALKYSGENCTVNIAAERKDGLVVITVSDNGPGIAQKEKDKIFDKFYRIPTQARHDVKGFGVGLSYVKTVVGMHGGSVTLAESEKGAKFIVTLPAP